MSGKVTDDNTGIRMRFKKEAASAAITSPFSYNVTDIGVNDSYTKQTSVNRIEITNQHYLGNNTIQIIHTTGTVGGTSSAFVIAVKAVVANNDNAFKSVVVNGTTYNRSRLTYLQSVGDTSWRLSYTQAPQSVAGAP